MTADPSAPSGAIEADILDGSAAGQRAARGGAVRVVSFVGGSLTGLAAATLLYRHLGRVGVGHYGLILALIGIIGGVSDLGLTVVGTRQASQMQGAERTSMLRDLLGLRVTLTVVGILVIAVVCVPVYPSVIPLGVLIGGVGLVFQVWLDNYIVSLVVSLRMGLVAAIDFGRSASTAALTVVLVLAGGSLLSFVGIAIITGAAALAVGVHAVRGERALTPTFNAARWRALISTSLIYSAAVTAAVLYFYAAVVLTSLLSNNFQLGYFQLSFRITSMLTIVPALLSGSALPIFARAARDDAQRLGYALGRVFEVSLLLGAWVALTLAVGARLAVEIVGGTSGHHDFRPSIPVLVFQGIALGGTFVGSVAQYGLLSLALNRRILLVNLGGLLGAIVVMCVLIPLDGARGAAIGTMIGELGTAAAAWTALVRARPQLRPSLRVVPGVALAALGGCAPLLLTSLPLIARIVLSTAIYAAIVLLTRSFPNELAEVLPARLRPLARGR